LNKKEKKRKKPNEITINMKIVFDYEKNIKKKENIFLLMIALMILE
jgi:hypothetical protein